MGTTQKKDGGFKYFNCFHPDPGEAFQVDEHIFSSGLVQAPTISN